MPWRQISPQQLLAQKNSPPRITPAQRKEVIESIKDSHIRGLLKLQQKLDKSLPLLLHEAISDLLDKYKHVK